MIRKWFSAILVTMLILALSVGVAYADTLQPYASKEINSSSVSLLSTKKIVYTVSLTSQDYSVCVDYCKLYKKDSAGEWQYVCSMSKAIPPEQTGNLDAVYDISSYITSSGTYQVRVSITSGSTTVYHSPSRTY